MNEKHTPISSDSSQLEPVVKYCTTMKFCGKPEVDHVAKTITSPSGKEKLSALGYGFANQETSYGQMFHWLTVDGFPYAPHLKTDGHRHRDNFDSSYLALVDIDHGMTLADLNNDSLYQKYGSGFYTTASHTEEAPRFRILFRLETPVSVASAMVLLNKALIRYYGTKVADTACQDPCRLFYGSVNAQSKEITDRFLPTKIINRLIEQQQSFEAKQKKAKLKAQKEQPSTGTFKSEQLSDSFKKRVLELAKGMYLGHYPDWIRFGWGLKEGGFDVSDFCYVTQGMMSQKTDADAIRVWNDGNIGGGVTMGTCIHMLKKHYGDNCFDGVKRHGISKRDRVPSTVQKKRQINCFISDPGTGKSTALCNHINNSSKSFIIAVPSLDLMIEYRAEITNSVAISHGKRSVGEQLNYALNNNERVIIITHAALIDCIDEPTFKKLGDYNLCIDEVFQPLKMQMLKLKKSIAKNGILRKLCKFKKLKINPNLYRLKIKDVEKYRRYIKSYDTKDTIENEETRRLLNSIADPSKAVIICEMEQSKQGNYCVATLFNIHLLKCFKSVTLVSAFLEHTMLYHLLDQYYNMVNVTEKFNLTRNLNHRFSSLVLMYLTENNYSKYFRDRTRFFPKNESTFYIEYCKDHNRHHSEAITIPDFVSMVVSGCDTFDVNRTLMVSNLDDSVTEEEDVGIKMSAMSHGINKHQNKHSIAYAAAFNLPPWTHPFLRELIPDYDPWFEMNVLTAVQDIMRTSLRNSESNKTVNALLPDKRTCLEIKSLLYNYPEIKKHCLTNIYDHYTLENIKTERIKLTEEEKRERKRISNMKFNASIIQGVEKKVYFN
ncbi:MAG: hypothetical protein PHH11_01270 [Methylomonas sp.]|nr:hypothetical protein [Methylomonas sp.]